MLLFLEDFAGRKVRVEVFFWEGGGGVGSGQLIWDDLEQWY